MLFDAQHAAAAECRVEHLVAAGQRPGVRRRRLGRRLGAARLDHDDRLGRAPPRAPPRGTTARRRSSPCKSRCYACADRRRGSRSGRPSRRRASSRSRRNALKPTRSRRLQSRIAVHSAPLWLMKPTLPGRAIAPANVALRPLQGAITPRQFGPISRIRPRRASASDLALQAQRPRRPLP